MKKIILIAITAFCSLSLASFTDFPSSSDYPSQDQWAMAMISMACDIEVQDLSGTTVSVVPVKNGGVVYTAKDNGQVVAQAWASNKTIFSSKKCFAN